MNLFSPECIVETLINVVYLPSGLLLAVSGTLLNYVIEVTILNFKTFVSASGGSISLAWSLIRDVLNMVFIFMLLYIGIGTILGLEKVNYQKMIPKIIIAGLLINFSFFFTSVLIDASNVLTVELHNSIKKIDLAASNNPGAVSPIKGSLSAAFMHGLKFRFEDLGHGSLALQILRVGFAVITMLVATFVFFVMSAMLLVRFLILIILLITSPIAVMGDILPQLSAETKKWWDKLFEQLIFAPVFMLFMLVVIIIISSKQFRSGITGGGLPANADWLVTLVTFLIPYALAIGLMIAGLVIAKQLSGSSGKAFVSWAGAKAGSATFGLGAWAGRRTLGGAGAAMADSQWAKRLSTSNNLGLRAIGRGAMGTGDKLKTSSFDVRGIAGTEQLGAGKAQKGGYEQWYKDQKKKAEKRKERYGAPTFETQRRLKVAQHEELVAKDKVRLATTPWERERAVRELAQKRQTRVDVEKRAKQEKAESQLGSAYREQQTVRSATTKLGKAGSLLMRVVNPADFAAAAEAEKKAMTDLGDAYKQTVKDLTDQIAALQREIDAPPPRQQSGFGAPTVPTMTPADLARKKQKKDELEALKAYYEQATKASEKKKAQDDFASAAKKVLDDQNKGDAGGGQQPAGGGGGQQQAP